MSNHAISDKSSYRPRVLNPAGTVFTTFTALANEHKALNLGQGFPSLPTPQFIKNEVSKAAQSDNALMYQYTRSQGHPKLVQKLSEFYGEQFGRKLDPMDNFVITNGASQAINTAVQAFVEPGDEVILMRPYFDIYPASCAIAGAKIKYVNLLPADSGKGLLSTNEWHLDLAELEKVITPGKTKMLMLNNPNNPVGKVFTRAELEGIAALAIKHDFMVFSDEVYDQIVYSDSPEKLIRMASLPGMWERTVTFGSAGKTFQITGIKLGWCVAPKELIRTIWLVHQYDTFVLPTVTQEAVAGMLEHTTTAYPQFFEETRKTFQHLRDVLVRELETAPHLFKRVYKPDAGYFITSELTETSLEDDDAWSRWLTKTHGVATIPCSAFIQPKYSFRDPDDPNEGVPGGRWFIRWACCKPEDMILEVGRRLREAKQV